jgi:hypothetical protein
MKRPKEGMSWSYFCGQKIQERSLEDALGKISFYLRSTPRRMMMVMKFWVDVRGEGESNSTLSRRWLKHSGASRKCYT